MCVCVCVCHKKTVLTRSLIIQEAMGEAGHIFICLIFLSTHTFLWLYRPSFTHFDKNTPKINSLLVVDIAFFAPLPA